MWKRDADRSLGSARHHKSGNPVALPPPARGQEVPFRSQPLLRSKGEMPYGTSYVLPTEAVEKLAAAPFRAGDPGRWIFLRAPQAQFGPLGRNCSVLPELIKSVFTQPGPSADMEAFWPSALRRHFNLWWKIADFAKLQAMNGKGRGSPYARGKRHMVAAISSAILIVWIMPIGIIHLGIWPDETMPWMVPLLFGWFTYFGVGGLFLSCPRCRRSVSMRDFFVGVPWPARECGKCGQDLTIEE